MYCADKVDAEVGMEVSVSQEFSRTSMTTVLRSTRISKAFRDQVRRKGGEIQGVPSRCSLGPGCPLVGGSDRILGISDKEDLPKRAGIQEVQILSLG